MAGQTSSAWGAGAAIWIQVSNEMLGSHMKIQRCKPFTCNMDRSGQLLPTGFMVGPPSNVELGESVRAAILLPLIMARTPATLDVACRLVQNRSGFGLKV